jgi:hypothetical protein
MKLIDEALLDQARSKALARRRSNRRATVLLPSQAELVLPLIGVGGDPNSPAGIDNAPYLAALVQSSLIAIASGTAAEAAASMLEL